jgi:nitrogenase molybdenum-iron protein alpha chain
MSKYDPDQKLDLEKNTCPNREQRANGTNIYYGKATELIKDAKAGNTKCSDRQLQQSSGCVLNFYLTTRVSTIRDAAIIFHGPLGCSSSALGYRELFRSIPVELGRAANFELNWITTNLQQNDVVYGASEKLKNAIFAAENRYKPKAIFIFSSCVSGIIGEDIDAVIGQLQEEITAPIIPVYCDGFKSKVWASGYDGSFQGALNYLIKEPKEKRENLVNIINPITFGRVDEIEVERLLKQLGLEANFIPNFSTTEDIGRASEAALTASLCTTFSEYFAKTLNERYHVPYTEKLMPVGLGNTDEWIREIGHFFGKEEEVESIIKSERERIQPKVDEIKEKLGGKKAFVSAGQSRAIGIPNLLADLGIDIVGITAYHYDEVIADSFAQLEQRCGNFCTNVANVQPFEQTNILNREKPDLYFGHMGESVWAAKEGIPTGMVFNLSHLFVGYNGVVAFGNRILNLVNNSSFSQKISQHAKPIYRENWLNENPFKYHNGGELK